MKRSHRIAVLVGFMAIVAFANTASAMYNPSTGTFLQRDPGAGGVGSPVRVGQYRDGMNLYQYVRSSPTMGRDPSGLADERTACEGVCGGKIDNWIRDEIKAQLAGVNKTFGGKKPSIEDYLKWANGNQRYKDAKFFAFSQGISNECGTQPDKNKPGCGRSVTVCGKCVRSAILGNIMYGYVGHQLGFTKDELRKASDTKRSWGMTVDKYDEAAYDLGFDLQSNFTPGDPAASQPGTQPAIQKGSLEDFCAQFDDLLKANGDALKEGNDKGGYNDLSACKPCGKDTKETRHGGNESSRRLP